MTILALVLQVTPSARNIYIISSPPSLSPLSPQLFTNANRSLIDVAYKTHRSADRSARLGLLMTADACSIAEGPTAHPYNIINPIGIADPYNIVDRYAWEWRETRALALVFPVIVMAVQTTGNTHAHANMLTLIHTCQHTHSNIC